MGKIPKRACDTWINLTSKVKVPVWFDNGYIVACCNLTDGQEAVIAYKGTELPALERYLRESLVTAIVNRFAVSPQPSTYGAAS